MIDGPSFRRAERVLIALVALHSLAVGAVLFAIPAWGLRVGGWAALPDGFFPRQGGAFHMVLGLGYLIEYARHRTVTLLLLAKGAATLFLTTYSVTTSDSLAWSVPASAAGDAAMGLAAWWLHRRVAYSAARRASS